MLLQCAIHSYTLLLVSYKQCWSSVHPARDDKTRCKRAAWHVKSENCDAKGIEQITLWFAHTRQQDNTKLLQGLPLKPRKSYSEFCHAPSKAWHDLLVTCKQPCEEHNKNYCNFFRILSASTVLEKPRVGASQMGTKMKREHCRKWD